MIAEEEVVPETFDGEAVHRALEQILAGFENLREWPKIRNRVLQALGIRGGIEFLTYLLNNGAISRTTFIEEYPEIEDRNYYRIRELLEPILRNIEGEKGDPTRPGRNYTVSLLRWEPPQKAWEEMKRVKTIVASQNMRLPRTLREEIKSYDLKMVESEIRSLVSNGELNVNKALRTFMKYEVEPKDQDRIMRILVKEGINLAYIRSDGTKDETYKIPRIWME
jgi:hypothetical protein